MTHYMVSVALSENKEYNKGKTLKVTFTAINSSISGSLHTVQRICIHTKNLNSKDE